ncbi:MAG: HAMP domain-containing protein, partial [Bacteroidota bacterium]
MKGFKFSSIRAKFTFWFLLLALSPLLIGTIITYRESIKAFEEKTYDKLAAIRDLKVGQVETWIAERSANLNTMAHNEGLRLLSREMDVRNNQKLVNEHKRQIRAILSNYLMNYVVYEEIFIIDAKTGKVEISTSASSEGQDKTGDSYFEAPLKNNRLYIKDIYYSNSSLGNTMTFSVPLHASGQSNKEIIGIIVARVDLQNSLYKLLLNRTGLGKTGETLLVNKDVVALNELRWYANAPLKLQIKAVPSMNAARGKTGIVVGDDYRGEKVLAAYTYIPETSWGFVCKQDWAELSAPTNALGQLLLILFVISGILITLIVYYLSRSISSPIVELNTDTKKIAGGDYSIRNQVKSNNELGRLGESINIMVESIESKARVQAGVVAISGSMIGHSGRKQYSGAILKSLLKETQAVMGVFYTLNEAGTEFEH